jgi:hypothetical protein
MVWLSGDKQQCEQLLKNFISSACAEDDSETASVYSQIAWAVGALISVLCEQCRVAEAACLVQQYIQRAPRPAPSLNMSMEFSFISTTNQDAMTAAPVLEFARVCSQHLLLLPHETLTVAAPTFWLTSHSARLPVDRAAWNLALEQCKSSVIHETASTSSLFGLPVESDEFDSANVESPWAPRIRNMFPPSQRISPMGWPLIVKCLCWARSFGALEHILRSPFVFESPHLTTDIVHASDDVALRSALASSALRDSSRYIAAAAIAHADEIDLEVADSPRYAGLNMLPCLNPPRYATPSVALPLQSQQANIAVSVPAGHGAAWLCVDAMLNVLIRHWRLPELIDCWKHAPLVRVAAPAAQRAWLQAIQSKTTQVRLCWY